MYSEGVEGIGAKYGGKGIGLGRWISMVSGALGRGAS